MSHFTRLTAQVVTHCTGQNRCFYFRLHSHLNSLELQVELEKFCICLQIMLKLQQNVRQAFGHCLFLKAPQMLCDFAITDAQQNV